MHCQSTPGLFCVMYFGTKDQNTVLCFFFPTLILNLQSILINKQVYNVLIYFDTKCTHSF